MKDTSSSFFAGNEHRTFMDLDDPQDHWQSKASTGTFAGKEGVDLLPPGDFLGGRIVFPATETAITKSARKNDGKNCPEDCQGISRRSTSARMGRGLGGEGEGP